MSLKMYEAYRILPDHNPYEVLWKIKAQARKTVKEKLSKLYLDIVEGRSNENAQRHRAQVELFQAWLKENPDAEKLGPFGAFRRWEKEVSLPAELERDPNVYMVPDDEIWEDLLSKTRMEERKDKVDVMTADDWVHLKYGEQVTRYQKDLFALDVSVSVWTDKDAYLIAPYCERSSLLGGSLDFLKEMPEITDYAYWNNTDPDENVSAEEWEERGEVWNRITDYERWDDHLNLEIVSWMGWSYSSPMLDLMRARGETDL